MILMLDMAVQQHVLEEYYSYLMVAPNFLNDLLLTNTEK